MKRARLQQLHWLADLADDLVLDRHDRGIGIAMPNGRERFLESAALYDRSVISKQLASCFFTVRSTHALYRNSSHLLASPVDTNSLATVLCIRRDSLSISP